MTQSNSDINSKKQAKIKSKIHGKPKAQKPKKRKRSNTKRKIDILDFAGTLKPKGKIVDAVKLREIMESNYTRF